MEKIPSVFQRDYKGDRLVYNEVVLESQWVLDGEGRATVKIDGTCCKVEGSVLFKRYDRKLTRKAKKQLRQENRTPVTADFKPAPEGWQAAEASPNIHTGHWPGWIKVDPANPEDQYFMEAWLRQGSDLVDGTYELVGPKVNGNPYRLNSHALVKHGQHVFDQKIPRTFEGIRDFLKSYPYAEGIVWHHPDGRMAKIKRRDFGFEWPMNEVFYSKLGGWGNDG